MSHSLHSDLNNPKLFVENKPGKYEYGQTAYGKTASGALTIAAAPARDGKAQRVAGGDDRRGKDNELGSDDGGHMIGARFDASPGFENITAQNSNLNRSSYKRAENNWADHLKSGDKVFLHIDTHDRGERPDYYMGYAIYEHSDRTRDWEAFGFNNESTKTQDEWDKALDDAHNKNPELAEEMPTSDMGGLSADEWEKANADAEEAEFGKSGGTYSSYLGTAVTSEPSSKVESNEESTDYLGSATAGSSSQEDSAGQSIDQASDESIDLSADGSQDMD